MVNLVYLTPNSTDLIAYASRFSTATQEVNLEEQMTKEEMNEKLVKKLIDKEHFTCLEFADAVFELEGSRNFSHQVVRHRHFSFIQESLRYTKSKGDFVIPPTLKSVKDLDMEKFNDIYSYLQNEYEDLIKKGVRKEDARFILPTGINTKIIMKGNFRSWMEFLDLRCSPNAQWEIRYIADRIKEILVEKTLVFKYIYGG